MRRLAVAAVVVSLLAGCAAPPSAPGSGRTRAVADELDPSGRPYVGPSVPVSNPPADNGTPRLSCHPQGMGERCDRTP